MPSPTKNLRGFAAICRKSSEIGWPEVYKDDLYVYDLEILCALPETQFCWLVRKTGTELLRPNSESGLSILHYYQKNLPNGIRAFWWCGDFLSEIPIREVSQKLFAAKCNEGATT